jgi:hypothetical protein
LSKADSFSYGSKTCPIRSSTTDPSFPLRSHKKLMAVFILP